MEQKTILTAHQKDILDELKTFRFVTDTFYFTGGTALSEYYLHHRYSEDIDLFSPSQWNLQTTLDILQKIATNLNCSLQARFAEVVQICMLTFPDGDVVKVDFGIYPYNQVEKPKVIDGFAIDSLRDIATNKLLTISQRNDVKDFVDLYFLLKTYSIWDLTYSLKSKFKMETESILLAADLIKAEKFTELPKMIVPITLDELKQFYQDLSQKIAKEDAVI